MPASKRNLLDGATRRKTKIKEFDKTLFLWVLFSMELEKAKNRTQRKLFGAGMCIVALAMFYLLVFEIGMFQTWVGFVMVALLPLLMFFCFKLGAAMSEATKFDKPHPPTA